MARLPRQYGPLAYGIIQVTITTAVATGIATHQLIGFGIRFLPQWAEAWAIAWLTMLPVVIVVAPFVQRIVAAMTMPDGPKPLR